MAKCLVLGANGFIGSHLVDSLVKDGHSVRAFDRFSAKSLFEESLNIEIMAGDFLNTNDLQNALKGMDYVFHFISTTTPATAENDPLIDIETNIRMSVELFQLCVQAGVKKVIFASTGGAIYGGTGDLPHKEVDLAQPVSPYAIGKLTIEHYLRYFRVKHGLESIVVRISNPYGERQPFHRKQGVIPIFLENICTGQPITVLGDGSMVRDYIYVKDATQMISRIFETSTKHHTYNIGSGVGTSVNDLVAAVEAVSQKKAQVEHRPTPATFLDKVVLDTSRYQEEFNFSPATKLEEGLKSTLEYIKSEIEKSGKQ